MDKLYRIHWSDDSRFALVDDALERSDGTPAEPFNETCSEVFLVRRDDRPLADLLAILGGYCVLSERASNVIRRFSPCKGINWIPVIAREDSIPIKGRLWLASPTVSHDIIDRKHSVYRMFPGTNVIGHVEQWVVCANNLPDEEFFYAHAKWFVSDRVKQALEANEILGFVFYPVTILNC